MIKWTISRGRLPRAAGSLGCAEPSSFYWKLFRSFFLRLKRCWKIVNRRSNCKFNLPKTIWRRWLALSGALCPDRFPFAMSSPVNGLIDANGRHSIKPISRSQGLPPAFNVWMPDSAFLNFGFQTLRRPTCCSLAQFHSICSFCLHSKEEQIRKFFGHLKIRCSNRQCYFRSILLNKKSS